MSDDELGGFVPVDAASLRALADAASALARARAEVGSATSALLELCEDMKIDAVRRLAERGASAAQLERYEDAYAAHARRARERLAALDAACARVEGAVGALR